MPRQNKIVIRNGTTTPNAADFDTAEPAWDKTAGKLYIKDGAGSMVEVGGGGGGGLTHFVESEETASPNDTKPVDALTATDASYTNIDVALVAKGAGATLAQVPDGTATGGNKRGAYATDLQKRRAAVTQVASGGYAAISGGQNNTASGDYSAIAGGYENNASGNYSFIAGGQSNIASGARCTVAGGYQNTASNNNSTVAGGQSNTASGDNSAIAGGASNNAFSSYSFVGGGQSNEAKTGTHAAVCGGYLHDATGQYSFVGGGSGNDATGQYSFVGGGQNLNATATNSTVCGGQNNSSFGAYSFVGGGRLNVTNAEYSFIGGGRRGNARSIIGYHVFPACSIPVADAAGVSQSAILVLGRQTTDATATVLTSNSSAASTTNQVILPNNSAYHFKGSVIATVTGGGDTAAWEFKGAIKRGANAASTAIVGTVVKDVIAYDAGASAWDVTFTADTTNGGLKVEVTGAAATTIRWVAKLETTEVTY